MENFYSTLSMKLYENGYDANTVQDIMSIVSVTGSEYEIVKKHTDIVPFNETNTQLLKKFLATYILEGGSKNSLRQYENTMRHLYRYSGKNFVDITTDDIRGFLANYHLKGCKLAYINNNRNYISSFYKWLKLNDYIEQSPCEKIKTIKYQKPNKKPFSSTEIDKIRSACKTLKERAIIEFLLASGVRADEFCMLDISDINPMEKSVFIRNGKGGKERVTYINDLAIMHLQNYLLSRKDNSPVLFPNNQTLNHMTTSGLRTIVKKIGERSEITDVYPHRFRHTTASILVQRGMSLEKVQVLLGHTDIKTTMTYVHVNSLNISAAYHEASA